MAKNQICSTEGCINVAAYTTRNKPAWCADCLGHILWKAGLQAAEPFVGKPSLWWLTTCVRCGIQAHYRLEYILDKNKINEPTCRACYFKSWATQGREEMSRYLSQHTSDPKVFAEANEQFGLPPRLSREKVTSFVNKNGYELIGLAAEITGDTGHSTLVVRCVVCGRISAKRMGDIGWGCNCSRNQNVSTYSGRSAKQTLLKDSPDSRAFKWWDHELNSQADFDTVTPLSTRVCHFICPECGLRIQAKVSEIERWGDCPDCRERRSREFEAEYARLKRTPVAAVPELAAAWADTVDPRHVMVAGSGLYRFRCDKGHHPRISPYTLMESGCPHCRGLATAASRAVYRSYVTDVYPEVASQWHPTRNGELRPERVVFNSKRNVWWLADCCGHEWQEPVRDRNKYRRLRCPECKTILDSLAWHDPGLAAEWSPTNSVSAWNVRPTASTQFVPEWICSVNPSHVWQAPLASRSSGAECPECREMGKSRVELDHHAAASEVFGDARSGKILRDKEFNWRKQWSADITVELEGRRVVVEYDGCYWHSPPAKQLIDERKTLDLLAAGYVVVRLREDELPALPIAHTHYREFRVYSSAPRPLPVMQEVWEWLASLPA